MGHATSFWGATGGRGFVDATNGRGFVGGRLPWRWFVWPRPAASSGG